jgi:hypothetical protein
MTASHAATQGSYALSVRTECESGDESDGGKEDVNEPILADATTALDKLQCYLYTIKDSCAAQQHAVNIEKFIVNSRKSGMRQTTMRDFLQM